MKHRVDVLKKKNIDENEKNKILLIINKLKDDNTVGSKAILIYIIDSIKIFKIISSEAADSQCLQYHFASDLQLISNRIFL